LTLFSSGRAQKTPPSPRRGKTRRIPDTLTDALMLHAAQILPMGLQPSGARPDAPVDEAGAAEAFGALLAAEGRDGERAQAQ
jgi:hypothetical protein